MKKGLVLSLISILFVSACTGPLSYELSQETEVYREFKLIAEEKAFHSFSTAKKQIWEHESLKAKEGDAIPLTTNDCNVSVAEGSGWRSTHIIDCVDEQYLLKPIEEMFAVLKNDIIIFESPMFQGSEVNPIIKAQSLNGELILSFTVMHSYGLEGSSWSWGLFWEGSPPPELQDFEQIRAVFENDDKIGFLATDPIDGMTYLYYDGKTVSPAYDSVRLTTCCAADPHVYSLYSNGAFMFMGKRNDEYFLTEVNLGY